MHRSTVRKWLIGLTGGAASVPLLMVGTASASPGQGWGSAVYVSPSGAAGARGLSCGSAAFSSIQAAVEAAPVHGTVIVCPGTYTGSVTLDKSLSLEGRPGAVIDATGQLYGIGAAASYSSITGLTVENASVFLAPGVGADGIVTVGTVNGSLVPASHITISGDTTENNGGSGIDLNSTSYSTAVHNRSTGNGVGVNMADDLGVPTSHNAIIGNVADDNPGGCGIALADHTGFGVFDNLVAGNVSDNNGLGTPSAANASAGSGVILADPGEATGGGVYDNTITGNSFSGNGHAGVDVHAHAPGLNFSGNVVTFNRIGTNNLRTYVNDTPTTGVYLGDASPLAITVQGNVISDDTYGIFTAGTVTVTGATRNVFVHVATPLTGVASF
ncbi:MAG: right-handed parallel beta-helix repeat-containing protein [Acidimicrobiaceae bacterium]|nr:right-handed parallel beta-helix repeat-containing protein [Acidimicrobiaceae bacterium]